MTDGVGGTNTNDIDFGEENHPHSVERMSQHESLGSSGQSVLIDGKTIDSGLSSNYTSRDKNHRPSMISDYSATVDEGVEVSFIVRTGNNDSPISQQSIPPILPTLPSNVTLKLPGESAIVNNGKDILTNDSGDDILFLNSNVKSVSRKNSTKEQLASNLVRENSLKLLSVRGHVGNRPSIASGHLASESGSSAYGPNHNIDSQVLSSANIDGNLITSEAIKSLNQTFNSNVSKSSSISSSAPLNLQTEEYTAKKVIHPNHSESNTINPSIPPRNRNRPRRASNLRSDLNKLEDQIRDELQELSDDKYTGNTTLPVMNQPSQSDVFYSAVSLAREEDIAQSSQDDINDHAYLQRPLPTTPNSTSYFHGQPMDQRETSASAHEMGTKGMIDDDENDYEDIEEDEELKDKNTRSNQHYSQTAQHKNNLKNRDTVDGKFDIATISQLLKMAKSSFTGTEMSNLGLDDEEKRSIERLIDALSRLTSNIILEPDRYDEGLQRLKRAIKALEGF